MPEPRPASRVHDEGGWVIVPVVALLAIGLMLAFAALLLVDRQTQAAGGERVTDAAQTLAEGAATATANMLASDESDPLWTARFSACETVSGNLAGPPSSTASFAGRVQAAVNDYFDAATASGSALSDYVDKGGRSTRWTVYVCPTDDNGTPADPRWDDAAKLKTAAGTALASWPANSQKSTGYLTPAGREGQPTLWVRAQGDVRPATGSKGRSRAVAAKVQRGATKWQPDPAYALATGNFDNDLGTVTGQVFGSLTTAVGQKLLNGALGEKGLLGKRDDLIGDAPPPNGDNQKAKIGVRCGLLQGADDTVKGVLGNGIDLQKLDLNLCLGGVFGQVSQLKLLQKTGLDTLTNPLLGIDRYRNLNNYAMAPAAVVDAYKSSAKAGDNGSAGALRGVYRDQIAGTTYNPNNPGSVAECNLPWNQITADTVVYVDKIGDGDQSCSIDASRTVNVRVLVINRGRIVIRGKLNGVVYALNGNECANAPSTGCTQAYRAAQPTREVVRIEGSQAVVTGAVWTDGVRSKTGIYPGSEPGTLGGALGPLLSAVASPVDNTLCSLPVLGPLLSGLTNLLGDILTLVTGGTVTAQLPAGSAGPPSDNVDQRACGVVRTIVGQLANLPGLSGLISAGGPTNYGYDKWEKCVPGVLNLFCAGVGTAWRKTGTGTGSQTLPAGLLNDLLNSGPLNNVKQLLITLGGTNHTMLVRDPSLIGRAAIDVPDNASFVPGSFRSVVPRAAGT
ncbi:hypothetical protein [Patulibacter defluvii]|uniref:hypothetical protein n=1 Tax=Patulibacter defluvii TaxID=3095358 RepID=UPI002A755928|nr:hypothetical protein [Patulibacter sp. DM4]